MKHTGKGGNLGLSVGGDGVTAGFDAAYGDGFIKSEKFVEMLYQDLSR